MKLAVIPARGGSKRIPRKNIRTFCGKPMIAWSIAAAQASGCFDRIIVSTDDIEIAETARASGAEVPFMRPPELADDFATTVPVIAHATRWQIDNGDRPDAVCCIYATAPFVEADDLRTAMELLDSQDCDYVFSITSFAFPIARAVRLTEQGRVEMLYPEHLNTRSQDLTEAYHDAGQFYWGQTAAWLANRPIFSSRSAPVILPRYRVQDIDSTEDWERAEWMFRNIHKTHIDCSGGISQ